MVKDKDTFKHFFFSVYNYFVVKCFPEPVKITVLPGQGVRGVSEILFLSNCKFEGLLYMSVFSWYVQLLLLQAGNTTHC